MRWLDRFEEAVVVVLMAGMTLLAFAQVVARYVFNYSFVWALEVIGVMFAWLIFVGMAYGVRIGTHIGVDLLVRNLRPGAARVVGCVAAALCIGYSLVLAWGGLQYVLKMHEVGILMQDVPIPQWWPRAILPAGFLLLAFRFTQVLVAAARGEAVHMISDESQDALKLKETGTTGLAE
ncbi:TRAP transporter small permease [Ramlibacter algicola]|uniref:TRAP transporter small permease protein n=1 Tax=Ramlibacter algicola TaxID=2795217 RepID=A0A934Q1A0_9BURK|nr:TRAP transporter small permease [Ramlibacter algicola]MBK0392427.1 TRAP transporter small permease [Ramlibacter algicola]